ncbi:MAG: hypothetical protein ACRDHJ_10795 [Actinomycetota bacterium]
MTATRALLVSVALVLSACTGSGERACDLLEDVPNRVGGASLEQMNEVADAARESDNAEIRTVGEELAVNLTRRRVLESLAPGSFLDVIQANVDAVRGACRDLEATDDGST